MPTARPCPWCFNDAITVNSERVLSGWWSQVTCDECGATGPRAITSDPDNGEAKALDEWNDGWDPAEDLVREAAAEAWVNLAVLRAALRAALRRPSD